jgi:AraC-like DNA-binding protein
MQTEGNSRFAQDGRECALSPGDLTLIDPSRPFVAETGNMRCISLYLTRSSIQALLPHVDDYTARPIAIQDGPGATLVRVAQDLINLSPFIDGELLQLMAEALPNFVVAALKSECVPTGRIPARHKLSQLHRVRQFISENLTNPKLSPGLVSQHLKISTRQIHELFSGEEDTLMREVTSRRLKNCSRDLADPLLANRAISEIGRDWGFDDPTRFSKAFRAQFGTSPRAFRQAAERSHLNSSTDCCSGGLPSQPTLPA